MTKRFAFAAVLSIAVLFISDRAFGTPQRPDTPSSDGLAIVVTPPVAPFRASPDIELEVAFQNVSAAAFRLPGPIDPPNIEGWRLEARDVDTGTIWTGVASRRSCARVSDTPTVALLPGESRTSARIRFTTFGFVRGRLDLESAYAAVRALMQGPCGRATPNAPPALPPGSYAATLDVRFAESYGGDRNPVRIWFGGEVTSRPFALSIRD